MNIIITGVAGFMGSSLADSLLHSSHNLIVGINNFDDFYDKTIKYSNLRSALEKPNFHLLMLISVIPLLF